MRVQIAIFEDDRELAEMLREIMEQDRFQVTCHYDLTDESWKKADLILADYRNKWVGFEEVRQLCIAHHLPLVAISGWDTDFEPQMMKPFSLDRIKDVISKTLISHRRGDRREL